MAPLTFLVLAIVSVFAAANDLLYYKIPNWLTYPTMIVTVINGSPLKGLEGLDRFLHNVSGIGIGLARAVGTFVYTLLGMEWSP